RSLRWGAGPRAAQSLILAAKSLAAISGRPTITTADIRRVAPAVLRHRLITNYAAQADGITPDRIIEQLLAE
ncbi:MAG TPA: AAA family ATPase, partial [Planctomycetaceae bacterium]|nr:AAA family ATPase [Planctomycetaceae bacterium]